MNPHDVQSVARWLEEHDIEFVVVGGSAIERTVPVGTEDLDPLIAIGEWDSVELAIEKTKGASPLDPVSGPIRGTVLTVDSRRIDVEFITGGPFGGSKGGEAFVRFVRRDHSTEVRGVRYADPAVVWYMRLAIDDWEPFVYKIRRDARAGVPASTLEGVLRIARHFGLKSKLAPRVAWTESSLQLTRSRTTDLREP